MKDSPSEGADEAQGGASSTKKEQPAKKPKKTASKGNSDAHEWEIGPNRKVTVTTFRNQVKVDIREYYEKDGELLPGRKGISLNIQQWRNLKGIIEEVDAAIGK